MQEDNQGQSDIYLTDVMMVSVGVVVGGVLGALNSSLGLLAGAVCGISVIYLSRVVGEYIGVPAAMAALTGIDRVRERIR